MSTSEISILPQFALTQPAAPDTVSERQERGAWYKIELQQCAELGVDLHEIRLFSDPQIDRLLLADGGALQRGIALLAAGGRVLVLLTRHFLHAEKALFDTVQTLLERRDAAFSKHLISPSLMRFLVDHLHGGKRQVEVEQDRSNELQEFFYVVQEAVQRGASDIHFCAREEGSAILFRVEGHLVRSGIPISYERSKGLIRAVYNSLPDKGSNSGSLLTFETQQRAAIPCTLDIRGVETSLKLRFQITPVLGGFDAVMRILSESSVRFACGASLKADLISLGYLEDQAARIALASMKSGGGIVFAGVTGSGKTTTMYSMLGHIASTSKKTYSVEDPIEGKLYKVSQIQVHTTDDLNADQAISEIVKSLLRLDPDITMVSEIRGPETGSAFKQLIQTGHQTLSTVHASSALDIYERLASGEIGMPRHVLSAPDFLSLLVYQKLLRRMCDHCKIPLLDTDIAPEKLAIIDKLVDPAKVFVTNPHYCKHCQDNPVPGVAGRTVCAEVVLPDHTLLHLMQDSLGLDGFRHLRQQRTALDHPSSVGKLAIEVAIYKMSQGWVDPFEVEREFQPLELYLELNPYDRHAQ